MGLSSPDRVIERLEARYTSDRRAIRKTLAEQVRIMSRQTHAAVQDCTTCGAVHLAGHPCPTCTASRFANM
ncbi:MAG: hypothetical protein WAZ27_03570 [Minisyncoccia bacterium]